MTFGKKEIDQIVAALDSTLEDEGINEAVIRAAIGIISKNGEILFNLSDFLNDYERGLCLVVYSDSNTETIHVLTDGETYRLENIE